MVRGAQCFLVGLVLLGGLAAPVSAQDPNRVWENGSVWTITYVETKPAKFNDYIKDLSQVWRVFLEESKKLGDVLSYKLLSVQNTRDREPNVIILVEFKNMAAFDRSPAEFEKMAEKIMGSLPKLDQANINREELRTLRGEILARELVLNAAPTGSSR